MAAYYATLNGSNLPVQFSYAPYIPEKRISVQRTITGVVVQAASPQIVHGEGTLDWAIEAATPLEFQTLYNLYNTSNPVLYTFTGYWGESLQVYFSQFDKPIVRGRAFALAGAFQVICVTVGYNAEC